ncbi:hypothetical protein [Pseudoroseicyclus tamaricis]|uniref:Lipoprotein n=1 Tax=Pseudoroseicyclus tamaricis TaxID=2705421 RepID=A0A6B2JPE1_9RHOB|nr:hypothetical protein [Pseudoroseicyclus tamaricis]NDU99957.1 hypothetical protein [Pseudoroseicyclus tamaricis]
MSLRLCAALGLAALPLAAPALAATCAPHEDVVLRLAERYGESRQSIALAHDNAVVEVFASEETGTWTITMTRPGGPTCLVAAGVAYEALAEALPGTDAPA